MIQKWIALAVVFVIAPYLLGLLCSNMYKEKEESLAWQYLSGQLVLWGVFEILALFGIYLKWSLHGLLWTYGILIALLCVISCIWNRKRIWNVLRNAIVGFGKSGVVMWLVILLFLGQTGYGIQTMHSDDDDAFYVATAETAVTTDSLMQFNPYTGEAYASFPSRYVLSPFPLYMAVLSVAIGIKPVTLAHTIYPIWMLFLVYCMLYLLGTLLFQNKKTIGYFLILAGVILQYSGYSIYTQGAFLFFRSWQGKAVLASLLLPAVLYYAFRLLKKKEEWMDYVVLVLLMLSCCLVSSMGIMLGAIAMGLCGMVYLWETHRVKPMAGMLLTCLPNAILAVVYLCIR
ncbi:MAG: DUF6077 domain-containing protein [Lachnospiraceae bacterium]